MECTWIIDTTHTFQIQNRKSHQNISRTSHKFCTTLITLSPYLHIPTSPYPHIPMSPHPHIFHIPRPTFKQPHMHISPCLHIPQIRIHPTSPHPLLPLSIPSIARFQIPFCSAVGYCPTLCTRVLFDWTVRLCATLRCCRTLWMGGGGGRWWGTWTAVGRRGGRGC